jgi:hypothetical protein
LSRRERKGLYKIIKFLTTGLIGININNVSVKEQYRMTDCYLCGNQAKISTEDYGRQKIVSCPRCLYYKITDPAILRIQSAEFPEDGKIKIIEQVKEINNSGEKPLIHTEDATLRVSAK